MRELSLHILDIVQNSIAADADLIKLIIREDIAKNLLIIVIEDNGKGIESEDISRVVDPFVTSRKTREVGLGLSLFREASRRSRGDMKIESEPGKGTRITAHFEYNNIDRAPLGDIVGTIVALITTNPEIDFIYRHLYEGREFVFSTEEIKAELGDVSINEHPVLNWIEKNLNEELRDLYGGDL
ncbi:MAG: sensor histidine kinase [Firmicutes bacterium]|nr:sensor histidine kinase [Bacillota bacterium]